MARVSSSKNRCFTTSSRSFLLGSCGDFNHLATIPLDSLCDLQTVLNTVQCTFGHSQSRPISYHLCWTSLSALDTVNRSLRFRPSPLGRIRYILKTAITKIHVNISIAITNLVGSRLHYTSPDNIHSICT